VTSDDQPGVVPQNLVLLAKFPEHRESFFFFRPVLVTQTFLEVELAEVRAEFAFSGDEGIELAHVIVPAGAKRVRDRLGGRDLGPDEPERIDKRKLGPFLPFLPEVPKLKGLFALVAKPDRLVSNEEFREARGNRALHETRPKDKPRREPAFREEAPQEIDASLGGGIDFDLLDLGEIAVVRNEDAVNGTAGGDRNAVDQGVNGVSQKFETGNQRYVELSRGELLAQDARMVEYDFPGPPVNERTRVEIFNATDPEQPAFSHASGVNQFGLDRGRDSRRGRAFLR
jgi:hypothetical protein